MKKSVFIFSLILVLNFSLASAVLSNDVAYVSKSPNFVDWNVINMISSHGFDVDVYDDSKIKNIDFSNYNFTVIGEGRIKNVKMIPHGVNLISLDHYSGYELGFTDKDGVSRISSNSNLNVMSEGEILEVYMKPRFMLGGVGISYFYISDKNSVDGLVSVAQANVGRLNNLGDVVAYREGNGYGNRCFFGIAETKYWTQEAEDLFVDCVMFVNNGQVMQDDEGEIHDVRIDESLTNTFNAIVIEDVENEVFLMDEITNLTCGKQYRISFRTLNVGNFTEDINFFSMLGNLNWSATKENLKAGDSTATGSKTITINEDIGAETNYYLKVTASIENDANPDDNMKMREVRLLCGEENEEPECVVDDDCNEGFMCQAEMCVEENENESQMWMCEDDNSTRDDCLSFSSGLMTRCYLNEGKTSWDSCSSGWVEMTSNVVGHGVGTEINV